MIKSSTLLVLRIYIKEKERKSMTIEERKGLTNNVVQNLVLENREKLSVSGVLDVLSFDDEIIIIETELGLLTVKGDDLRINKLSIDTSEVVVEGDIYNMGYSQKDVDKKSGSFLSKIFK
jgi:sporulation protein YabP